MILVNCVFGCADRLFSLGFGCLCDFFYLLFMWLLHVGLRLLLVLGWWLRYD